MKAMFDPVIDMITALMQSQLDAEVRAAGYVSVKVPATPAASTDPLLTLTCRPFFS